MTSGEVERSINIKFQLPCQFQRFLYQTLCVFSQIKEKYIEHNFYSVAGVMPQGWFLGVLAAGGTKTLARGFAMAPHRLRILVIKLFCYMSAKT